VFLLYKSKQIPLTNIHPSKKETLTIKYQAEYTEKDEDIKNDYSNIKKVDCLDLNELIKIMFTLRQQNKFNIQIGYTLEDGKQWIAEDFTETLESYNDTRKEVEQNKIITKQREEITELKKEIELYQMFTKKYNAVKFFNEFKKNNIFWYELKFRGISPGCQPKDFIECDHTKGKYGILAYNRKLTTEELNSYDMIEYNEE